MPSYGNHLSEFIDELSNTGRSASRIHVLANSSRTSLGVQAGWLLQRLCDAATIYVIEDLGGNARNFGFIPEYQSGTRTVRTNS
jgi:hypothetical protein